MYMYTYLSLSLSIYIYTHTCVYLLHTTALFGTGQTGTSTSGHVVFFLPAVLGCVFKLVKFLKVYFPGGLGTH